MSVFRNSRIDAADAIASGSLSLLSIYSVKTGLAFKRFEDMEK